MLLNKQNVLIIMPFYAMINICNRDFLLEEAVYMLELYLSGLYLIQRCIKLVGIWDIFIYNSTISFKKMQMNTYRSFRIYRLKDISLHKYQPISNLERKMLIQSFEIVG